MFHRPGGRPVRRALAVLLLATSLAGCQDPHEAVVEHNTGQYDGPPEPLLLVSPRDGLVDVKARQWSKVRRVEPRLLEVIFASGVEECFGLARVDLVESPRRVTITLYSGRVKDSGSCILLGVTKRTRVRLAHPLGDRRIVDGAPRAPG